MINFMIFGDTAVNMALVTLMKQQENSVTLLVQGASHVTATGVTIDDILTAQAAGQARVAAFAKINAAEIEQEITDRSLKPLERLKPSFSQRRSQRFREPMQNDPQAMKSIGRR